MKTGLHNGVHLGEAGSGTKFTLWVTLVSGGDLEGMEDNIFQRGPQ